MKFLDVLLTALKCIVIELMDNMDIMHFKVVLTLEGTTPETSMTVQVKDIIISDNDIISVNCLNLAMCTLHTCTLAHSRTGDK